MKHMQAYLTVHEIVGSALPVDQLCDRVGRYGWQASFYALSQLAAFLANRGGPNADFVKDITSRKLRLLASSDLSVERAVAQFVTANDHRAIAHDQVVQFLQAVVVLEGKNDGPMPSHLEVAIWLISANDHVHGWQDGDAGVPSVVEDVTANLVHLSRYNAAPDPVRYGVRTRLIYDRVPPKGPFADEAQWSILQHHAFSRPYPDHFELFAAPLFIMSRTWGLDGADNLPVIDPDLFYAQTQVVPEEGKSYLESLSIDRAGAQTEIRKRMRGRLPHAPTLFYHRPLMKTDDGMLIASSPSMLFEHLKAGIWSRFLQAAEPAGHSRESWLSTFGYLFEAWVRRVASVAAHEGNFVQQLVVSDEIGEDEIEDVIFYDGTGTAVLCSVKGSLVAEESARHARSARKTLAWYERFLLAEKKGNRRAGALHLLDAKVQNIRAGKYSAIPASTKLIPMVITFDNIGDTPALYQWMTERLVTRGLLGQQQVSSVILSSIYDFELLMGLAALGESVVAMCDRKSEGDWAWSRFSEFLYEVAQKHDHPRLKFFDEQWERISEDVSARLFGKSKPDNG